jgi:hypothetical protein
MATTPSAEVVPNFGRGLITYIAADMGLAPLSGCASTPRPTSPSGPFRERNRAGPLRGGKRAPFAAQPELLKLRFGIFDDTFHLAWQPSYNLEGWTFFGRDRYKLLPAGGEILFRNQEFADMVASKWAAETRNFGITFMITNNGRAGPPEPLQAIRLREPQRGRELRRSRHVREADGG